MRRRLPLALAAACAACAPPDAPLDDAWAGMGERVREVASPKICLSKQRLLEELGHTELAAAAARREGKPEKEPRLERGPAPPVEVAYRLAAPSTVLIRTSQGMGSGVIVDPRGLVLTNQHVVDELLQLDLTIKVTLELGKIGPTGRIVPTGEPLEGVVVKTDAIKDLALVKLSKPPKKLPVATVAPLDPRVGEAVLSIGNAGIGLLWAAKVCNVSRVGDLTRETSVLEAGDCTLRDPSDDADEALRRQQQCESRKKDVKKEVEQALQGLSIQTTCSLNGGDSGGPLVNAWGEIVGLNQSLRFAGGTLAFHVHVAEIREFLADTSLEAVAAIPDPFCEGGPEVKLEDFDGNGVWDSAVAAGTPWFDAGTAKAQGAYLFDLDEDHARAKPSPERPFDADVAILLKRGDAYAFYDRDGDGAFDLLFRDKQGDGVPEHAYELRGETAIVAEALLREHTLDASLVTPDGAERLGATALGAGLAKLASQQALAAGAVPPVPDLARVFGKRGYVQDNDEDGKGETIWAMGAPGQQAYVVDVTSQALASLKAGDEAGPILDPWALAPQFAAVDRPSGLWALYDTSGDGVFDLALFAQKPAVGEDELWVVTPEYVTHAFVLAPGTPRVELHEHVGRGLVRHELLPEGAARNALRRAHPDTTRGAFPNPRDGAISASEPWTFAALERERQVLEQSSRYGHVALIDLDRNTKQLDTSAAPDLVTEDRFDAEMAVVRYYDRAWIYYDTNRDGAMDLVLFTRSASSRLCDSVVRLDPSGNKATSESPGGALLRPEAVGASPRVATQLELLLDRVLGPEDRAKRVLRAP